ncbi:MAG: hypothetical protein ACFB21_10580 [Opitutales bacterium]
MQGFNHDSSGSDGDWDHGGELAWNEADWQLYLKRAEAEQRRFLELYQRCRQHPARLDEIARQMQWDREDWSLPGNNSEPDWEEDDAVAPDSGEDLEPYTIHKHPVYIVSHALTRLLNTRWSAYLQAHWSLFQAKQVIDFSDGARLGELNAVMALDALEMGDFNLAVCHLKRALAGLNAAMNAIFGAPGPSRSIREAFTSDMAAIAFDLREVWLRVLSECREEARRDDEADSGDA